MKGHALLAAAAALCALPASAMASPSAGVVLTINSHKHAVQVVDSSHVVHAYHYRGAVQSVRPGTKINFTRQGNAIGRVHAGRGASHKITFAATVTRATTKVVSLRPADGKSLTFKTRQVRSSGTLTPGTTVMATELLRGGRPQSVTIAVTNADAAAGQSNSGSSGVDHSPSVSGPQDVNGTITQVSESAITITTLPGGQTMSFVANPDDDVNDGYLIGDQVTVTYNQLADGALKARDVEDLDQDVTGTVVAVSVGSVTLQVDGTGAVVTLVDDPSDDMFDGVNVGDQEVDVTYHVSAAGLIVDGIDD